MKVEAKDEEEEEWGKKTKRSRRSEGGRGSAPVPAAEPSSPSPNRAPALSPDHPNDPRRLLYRGKNANYAQEMLWFGIITKA